jgi:hypothetical protein
MVELKQKIDNNETPMGYDEIFNWLACDVTKGKYIVTGYETD